MNAQKVIGKWIFLVVLCLAVATSIVGCGKKPSKLTSPDESKTFPSRYPMSR
jgi:hypothetical protein